MITYKEQDDKILLHYYQDVEPHLNYAAALRQANWENRYDRKCEFRQTMSVPTNIILEIATKLGIPFGEIFDKDKQARILRELKSRDYMGFRTTHRKIG